MLCIDRGCARLLEAGTIRSKASDPLPRRLAELGEGLASVLDTFSPSVMGLEEVFSHYAHPAAAIAMAHARGVYCYEAARRSVKVLSIPASVIKKLVTGNGRASKEQVAGMVKHLLDLEELPGPADLGDALAVALAAVHSCGWPG